MENIKLYTILEAASILRLKYQTLWRYCKKGYFPNACNTGKKILIPEEDLKNFLEERKCSK